MVIFNRRDTGYTIISRFEDSFRNTIIDHITRKTSKFYDFIPEGVVIKANERKKDNLWDNHYEFMENIDFPDLKEITIFKDNYEVIIGKKIERLAFEEIFDQLYLLRCKIAHVKGYFTSIDLDRLIELVELIAPIFTDSDFNELLDAIKSHPQDVLVKLPGDFIEDSFERNKIIHNLPTPDYEYEGGFVGREQDKKKIKKYLLSEKFPVTTITGAGGVGKTALALKIIDELTTQKGNHAFDSILWLSAKENKLSPLGIEDIEPTLKSYEELLDTFIELFGFTNEIRENTVEEKEQITNSIIDLNERMLVIVDNLETITDDRIINFIIDAPTKVKFLVTSRKGIGQVERRHELRELKAKEAVYLFRQLAKDKQLNSLVQLNDKIIGDFVSRVSYYPLAIKWVVGQVARGKDINLVVNSIHSDESDISKFCFEQIFISLSDQCKKILFCLSLTQHPPAKSLLQHITELNDHEFEDSVEELIIVSLIIPEQFQNKTGEVTTRYNLLPLTKGFIRIQLSKTPDLREYLNNKIAEVESKVTESERIKKEYRHSLYNFGAKSDEEKIATIIAQNAFQKYQNGYYDSAVDEYKRAIKVAPNFAPIYRNWGVMESYENHLGEAIKLMEKASELDRNDPQIFLLWGNIFRKNGKFDEALKKYQIAHSLDNEDPIILNALGQALGRLGNFDMAQEMLEKSLKKNNEFNSIKHEIINKTSLAENLINWADLLVRDRNFGEAEKKYSKAISYCLSAMESNARDPKIYTSLTKAHLKKGHLYFQMNRKKQAEDCLVQVVKSKDTSFKHSLYKITAWIDLGEFYFREGRIRDCHQSLANINKEHRYSKILRDPKFSNLQERYRTLRLESDDTNRSNGIISHCNLEKGYIKIQDSHMNDYIGGPSDFIPKLGEVSNDLIGLRVSFLKKEFKKYGKKKTVAHFIKIIGSGY